MLKNTVRTCTVAASRIRLRQGGHGSNLKVVDAETAVSIVQPGHNVYVHGGAATPSFLLKNLTQFITNIKPDKPITLHHIHLEGEAPFYAPENAPYFRGNTMFIGSNARAAVREGRVDFIPVFLSEIPLLYRSRRLPLDVAFIHVSPPDAHGYCSLGVSVCEARAAIEMASIVVAQINPAMPRTFGDGFLHVSEIDYAVEVEDQPIPGSKPANPSPAEVQIGKNVASLIEDGSCLQMGIGSIPNACLQALSHHSRLGIHTEMFSDGILDLIKRGVITGMEKYIHPGKIVASFAVGSKDLYSFMDNNSAIAMLDVSFVNNPGLIAKNPKTIAINSCIEIDLTGQVCADSIGTSMYSGIGGQVDFMRGAALSPGGKPIFAFTSTTNKGVSRITPTLKEGAGVVTTRAHVHWVVTEYGMVNLFGMNLGERAKALISIAHPDHREALAKAAVARFPNFNLTF